VPHGDLPTCGGDGRQARGGNPARCTQELQSTPPQKTPTYGILRNSPDIGGRPPKIKISPRIFPTPCPCPYNHAVPQRIHRQACRRCGAGALRQETTQILRQRVRELVSLRRHGGNGGALDRSCRFISGHERRACLCGTQGNRRLASAARGPAGSFPSGKFVRCGRRQEVPPFGFCRESGSRAKTVERGAERCQFLPNPCGSFQRPDRFDRQFNFTTGHNRPRGRKPVRRRKDGS
jgi:hypothetical protein